MDSPASSSSGAPRRHLKRLSLSVSPRHDLRTQAIAVNAQPGEEGYGQATATPDRRFNANGNGSLSAGPLSRSAGPGGSSAGRRARPTSMYASTSGSTLSPFNNAGSSSSSPVNAAIASDSPSPLSRTALPALPEDGDAPEQQESFSPTSSLSRATGNGFNGRRSLLGRSPHARGQSSISYARSSGSDSGPCTPRSSIILSKGENISSAASNGIHTPASTSSQKSEYFAREDGGPASQDMVPVSSTTSVNEMNVGMIGAKSADLLTFIAKKERRCMDLREELKKHEEELVLLKKKWEAVVQREMQALQSSSSSAAAASSAATSPSSTLSPLPATQGLFSSLTSSLGASSSSSSSPANASLSPSPKPQSAGNRRLLTARHSISVASPSKAGNNARTGFLGGNDLTKQDSASSNEDASSIGSADNAYDVSKMARSWLGGMVKSASSVLETLAVPPPASNDLGTVREEEEPEEEEATHRPSRTSAGHPSAHGRKVSEGTLANETSSSVGSGSPISSCEEGRFSTSTSRSSSVSSMHSDPPKEYGNGKGGDDITPVATPVIETAQTPKGGNSSAEAEDLWGLSGFEDDSARDEREKRERERIDVAHTSPPRPVAASRQSLASASKPAHGRRRSTAFELGGAWGSIVGKKWNEVANSEVLKKSTRATMNFVDTFEKTITDAMAIDGSPQPDGSATSSSIASLDGDYHPWMDSATIQAPLERERERERERGLPAGIGGAGSWTALLSGAKKATTPKQRAEEWSKENSTGRSPASASAKQGSLLDEQDDEEARDTFAPLPLPLKQQMDTPQARLQASRAKHSKRMSLPSNLLVGDQRKSSLGLGLESLNEEDDKAEAEDGWGW